MKTFIISIVMLLILVSGIFFAQHVMVKKVDNQVATLYDLFEDVQKEEWVRARQKVEGFSRALKEEELFFGAMVEHIDYDTLLSQSAMMREFVFHNAKSDSSSQTAVVITLLEHIKDKTRITWENIL
ncbi:DUF4363 family protein [Treponema sp. R6D11]